MPKGLNDWVNWLLGGKTPTEAVPAQETPKHPAGWQGMPYELRQPDNTWISFPQSSCVERAKFSATGGVKVPKEPTQEIGEDNPGGDYGVISLVFKNGNGQEYDYPCPRSVWVGLLQAASPGTYVHEVLKQRYSVGAR